MEAPRWMDVGSWSPTLEANSRFKHGASSAVAGSDCRGAAVLFRYGGCLDFGRRVERNGTACGRGCDRFVSGSDKVSRKKTWPMTKVMRGDSDEGGGCSKAQRQSAEGGGAGGFCHPRIRKRSELKWPSES
jgi:hypothetical protein